MASHNPFHNGQHFVQKEQVSCFIWLGYQEENVSATKQSSSVRQDTFRQSDLTFTLQPNRKAS
jgi:hypothetical protein